MVPMPARFEQRGVSFLYPDNWRLEEEPSDEASLQLTVFSPGTAFWSLAVYPGFRDVRDLLDEVVRALQAEYPDLEQSPADEWIGRQPLVGCDAHFFYLDLTNTVQVRVFQRLGETCLVIAQSEDRELGAVSGVFHAMTLSLLSGAPGELPADGPEDGDGPQTD